MNPIIAPSMLSANFAHLEADIQMINESSADWFHLDIMDGLFVPNISFGFPVIQTISQQAEKPLDVHLMIVQPERYISNFKAMGTQILTVHWEACTHLHRTIYQIKEEDMLAGIAINPHTPISFLEDIIADADMILVMSVNPGFGGQQFIENSYQKIADLRELIIRKKSNALIEVDGGVNLDTAPLLIKAGADVLVAGNSIFKSDVPAEIIHKLKYKIK